jgi:ABC-type transport system substrate-binding protein
MYQASIVPEEEVSRSENGFGHSPVGSGPFKFVSWTTNQSIRLERFSDYHTDTAFLDEIHFRIYPGGNIERALTDFQSGNLEEMPVYGNIRLKLSGEKDLQWFHRPSLSLLFYGLKGNHELLKNPDFRKALSMAIDREKLVKQVYKGQFEPARTVLPPGMPAYNRQAKLVLDDLAMARDHLRRALKKEIDSVPPIEIVSTSKSAFAQAELKLVKESWAQLEIPVKIKFITDWAEFEAYLKSDSVQIYRYAWFADLPDPDNFLYPLFASDSPVNFTGYKNEEVDRMLVAARGMVNPVKRVEMYQRIETLVLKSSPIIPLFYLSIDRVYRSTVQGVQLNAIASELMSYHRIWLKTRPFQK